MNDLNNNKSVQVCKEIFDIYIEFIVSKLKKNKNTLIMIDDEINKEKNRINTSDDFKLKVKYALSNLGKIFAVAVLGVDIGFVPFDDYRYYKMKKTGVVPGNRTVLLDELNAAYNRCNEIVNFYVKLYEMVEKSKNIILSSPELAEDFFYRFSKKSEDSNFYYRLFEVLDEMGIDIKEVYDMAKSGFVKNIKSKNFDAVNKLNACVQKYGNENGKKIVR